MKARNEDIAKLKTQISEGMGMVGARHKGDHLSGGGGGYQDNCISSGLSVQKNRALDELREIGLSAKWLPLVEKIGIESFIAVWHHLDAMTDSGKSLYVPCISRYHSYQRNLVIRSLSEAGYDNKAIQKYLKRELKIKVHVRTIERAIAAKEDKS